MRNLTQRLIAVELRSGGSDTAGRAAFRVSEKLGQPLCTFAGVSGFRSLVLRALVLAKADAPLLDGVQIRSNGTLQYSPELEAQLGTAEADKAASVLTDQLLDLLIIFIGEALTLRLVHDVWPKVPIDNANPRGK